MAKDTIVTGAKLTALADALRAKLGTQDTYTLDQMATAIASIAGGDDRLFKGLIDVRSQRMSSDPTEDLYSYWAYDIGPEDVQGIIEAVGETSSSYPNPGDSYDSMKTTAVIRPAAFAYSVGIRSVTLPDGIGISGCAFVRSRIEEINFLGSWSYYAPYYGLPNSINSLSGSPFQGCEQLASLDMSGMANTTQLNGLSYLLAGCQKLADVTLPNATTMPAHAFEHCAALTRVEVPATFTSLSASCVFNYCTRLEEVDILGSPSINGSNYGSGCFSYCDALKRVIIHGSTVATLSGQYPFKSGTAGGVPTEFEGIYVPDGLVASYQAASNWSAFSAHIKPISDL